MIITCEQCQTRFRLADDKVKPGGSKVRCSKCRHVFTILPPPAPDDSAFDFSALAIERTSEAATTAAAPEPAEPPATTPTFAPAGPAEFDFGFSADTAAAEPAVGAADQTAADATPVQAAEPLAAAAPARPDHGDWDAIPSGVDAGTTGAAEPTDDAAGDLNWLDGTEEDADRFAFAEEPDTAESGEGFPSSRRNRRLSTWTPCSARMKRVTGARPAPAATCL